MSKGLEALQEIKSKPFSWEKLKDSLDIIEKELKAFEIIKEKLVNLFIVAHTDSKEAYNDMVSEHWRELTQEEYELLKEVLL